MAGVLRADRRRARLYSAGEFGSVWSNKYEGCGNIGECCAFGRIAARNALKA